MSSLNVGLDQKATDGATNSLDSFEIEGISTDRSIASQEVDKKRPHRIIGLVGFAVAVAAASIGVWTFSSHGTPPNLRPSGGIVEVELSSTLPPVLVASGTCASHGLSMVTTASDCQAAARSLGVTINHDYSPWSYPDIPAGCSVRWGDQLFFQNPHHNCVEGTIHGSCHCAEAPNQCMCRGHAPPPPPIVVTSGTCESHGMLKVATESDCRDAAFSLGLTVNHDYSHSRYPDIPAGCSFRWGDQLFFQEPHHSCVEGTIHGSCHCAEAPNQCLCRRAFIQ